MSTLRLLTALALTLGLAGCPQTGSTADTGSAPGPDAHAAEDAFVADEADAFVPGADAHVETDAFVPGADAHVAADAFVQLDAHVEADAFVAPDPDAGFRGDAGVIDPGECDPTACTPTCFRPITCVKVCGGPETACGCCACATGSFDPIGCGSSM